MNADSAKSIIVLGVASLVGCSAPKPVAVKPSYFKVDPSTAGVVMGKILFTGNAVPSKQVDMEEDPQCNKLHKAAVLDRPVALNKNGTLANVFVYIKGGLDGRSLRRRPRPR